MEFWRKALLNQSGKVSDAIRIIDESSAQICLVVDDGGKLVGTITDGDVRRAILRGQSLDDNVATVMNSNPRVVGSYDFHDELRRYMEIALLRQVPVVDDQGRVIGLIVDKSIAMHSDVGHENIVVLMAGGLGNRLRPLTNDIPKPLLQVGSRPLLETILRTFVNFGFRKFYISVNYKAEMIMDYFGDGSALNCSISYIEEESKLGTAGALSLLPERPTKPLIVMNADLLTKVNFENLLQFHYEHKSLATMCVREYDFQVPYGVVSVEDSKIVNLSEKPVHSFFVNAGIYVLDPQILDFIQQNNYCDMTDIFGKMIQENMQTSAFPIREYWLDIGRIDDYERANGEFSKIFGQSERN